MWFIELIFTILCVIATVSFVCLITFLIIQLVFFATNVGSSRKSIIISGALLLITISLINFIYEYFGIYLFINISIYENIFFEVLQIVVSVCTILLTIYLMIQIVMFAGNIGNPKKIKPILIFTSIFLIGVVGIVLWAYQITGLMLFTDIGQYIY